MIVLGVHGVHAKKNKDCSQSVKNECTTTINTVVKNPRCKNSCS